MKTWEPFFDAVQRGFKTFEIRKDDRSFDLGDVLVLRHWDPTVKKYSGRYIVRQVSYVLRADQAPSWGLAADFVVLGIREPDAWMLGDVIEKLTREAS